MDSLVSVMTDYFHHTNVLARLSSMTPKLLSQHAEDCWQWAEGGLTLLAHNSASWNILHYLAGALLLFFIYRIAFLPIDRVRDMTEVGWGCLGGTGKTTLAERIREVQRLRKKGNLPPVYPNGWFAVLESRELSVGQVVSVQVFGQTLAVFRGQDGEAHVTDAYCPHIGANLAVGGVVRGNCIECPFHGWRFRGSDGKCVEIPYSSKVPKTASVRRWENREKNGFILVWHDAEARSPMWELPEVPHIADGSWAYRGRTAHEILAHIQEMPENGADVAHLGHLHVPSIFKGSDLRDIFAKSSLLDIAKHTWSGEWRARAAPENHAADLTVTHSLSLFGGRLKLFPMTVKVEQLGPGVVHLHFNTWLGSGVLIQTVTPLEPLRQKVVHQFHSSWTFIAPYAKFVILSEARHFERDVMVWNNKQYLSQPLLVSEDRFIVRFRRWYSQFYSENSPKFSFKNDSLDW